MMIPQVNGKVHILTRVELKPKPTKLNFELMIIFYW